ncbi:MAG: DEAD/DEAH box helicase family protein, partial [Bacteroidales bacterium]|nr:DEAD/DEAH box helicase family protein [Bacteroidales bacterium]
MAHFDKKLVLSDWMLKQFGAEDFSLFQDILVAPNLIGFDEENVSHFYQELTARPFPERVITNDTLLSYDENIVRYWRRITEKRNHTGNIIYPLYFQYLALLFTEYYLDRYFTSRTTLCDDLNEHLTEFNQDLSPKEHLLPFVERDLNKLAIWIATGGGKTLIMHVNILQFIHYQKKAGQKSFNKTILLTPNEDLSRQHLMEFANSKITARLFDADKPVELWQANIDIIDIHKLKEKKGEKTVAIDSFETDNLVLVDEGHRGAGGKEWMAKRNQLCADGFSFEYSATFGQAIKATTGAEDPTEKGREKSKKYQLIQLYGKCILFDYSYKYFHEDGYGKDHLILNLAQEQLDEQRQLYLTACLLAFYQQKLFFKDNNKIINQYLLAEPLCLFVGGKVTAQNTVNDQTASDIQLILSFLNRFFHNQGSDSIKNLELLLTKRDDMRNGQGKHIFSTTFPVISNQWSTDQAAELFADILKVVFHAGSSGNLHVVHLKGSGGEIVLRVGENDFFGLVNVGDSSKLIKLCDESKEKNMVVTEQSFSSDSSDESYFKSINHKDSPINMLIGAKKFTEGWSSWRVSTMGLMNVGRSEGSEIIQLFGRGVRLKGYNFSLKRSSAIPGMKHPKHLPILETLNVFGIRSNYMEEFEEYLEEEGVGDNNTETIILPVIKRQFPDDLKLIRLKEDLPSFKEKERPRLETPPDKLNGRVTLNWYPKIQARKSTGEFVDGSDTSFNEGRLNSNHLAFLDFDTIYFE